MCEFLDRLEEKGAMKGAIEIALRMLKAQMSEEKVAEYSGLPLTKVLELKNGFEK